ncbi:MAG: T9SS type A sorting domain-containing protein [Lewinellaceae bacterium]|nr:T9SS type A sorting domain-containing protein [Lewinellaceae bacterium]
MSMNFNNQTLNLKYRYGYRSERRITQEEIDSLRIIAMSYEPASGYARSIYHMLEGEVLPIDIPDSAAFSNTNSRQLNLNDLDKDGYSNHEITIYPNPVDEVLNIISNSNQKLHNISLMSIDGRLVFSTNNIRMKKYSMDVSHLSAGIYIIKISTDTGEKTIRKIIIK